MSVDASLPHPNPAVIFCEVESGAVLLDAANEVYYGLNHVGCDIWKLLPPASTSWPTFVEALAVRWPDAPHDVLRADAEELLTSLRAEGLVVAAPTDG